MDSLLHMRTKIDWKIDSLFRKYLTKLSETFHSEVECNREMFPQFGQFKRNLDCKYTPIDLAPNKFPFGGKSIGKGQ